MMAGKQQSSKSYIFLDLLVYVALPYIIWNYGREPLGDYVAMLASAIPGIIYTIYRLIYDKQVNLVGLFILGSLILETTVNLLSGSAEQMIRNGVYLSLFYSLLFFVAFVVKRPFSLYFAVEFARLQGHEREASKELFYQKGIFQWFQLIQGIFIIRGIFMAALTVLLLNKYGIDGYDAMLIYKKIAGWVFSGLIMGLFIYINIPIRKYFDKQQNLVTPQSNS